MGLWGTVAVLLLLSSSVFADHLAITNQSKMQCGNWGCAQLFIASTGQFYFEHNGQTHFADKKVADQVLAESDYQGDNIEPHKLRARNFYRNAGTPAASLASNPQFAGHEPVTHADGSVSCRRCRRLLANAPAPTKPQAEQQVGSARPAPTPRASTSGAEERSTAVAPSPHTATPLADTSSARSAVRPIAARGNGPGLTPLGAIEKWPFCETEVEDTRRTGKTRGHVTENCPPIAGLDGVTHFFRGHADHGAAAIARFYNDKEAMDAGRIQARNGLVQDKDLQSVDYGWVKNGVENRLGFQKFLPKKDPREYFYVSGVRSYGDRDATTRAVNPKVVVLKLEGRQVPTSTGNAAIDTDRRNSLQRQGIFSNKDVDYFRGELIVKIEGDRFCPIGAVRTELRRTDLIRLSGGRHYRWGNEDYERFPDPESFYEPLKAAEKAAKLISDDIISRADSIACDSVTPEQIQADLERAPVVAGELLVKR